MFLINLPKREQKGLFCLSTVKCQKEEKEASVRLREERILEMLRRMLRSSQEKDKKDRIAQGSSLLIYLGL